MTRLQTIWLAILLASLLLVPAGRSPGAAFVELEGIPGQSTDPSHPDWIEAEGLAFGHTRAPGTGAPAFDQVAIVKRPDRTSAALALGAASGTPIPEVRVEFSQATTNRSRFYRVELSNVRVLAAFLDSAGTTNRLLERVYFSFDRISWAYADLPFATSDSADTQAFWDLTRNEGGGQAQPVFRVTCEPKDATTLRLSWPARQGRTYRILASSAVTGPYAPIDTITAEDDGAASRDFPNSGPMQFFLVEEGP